MSLLLVVAGIGIISQGWVRPVVSAAWEAAFGKPVHFADVSPLWGALLIVLGLGFFMWTASSSPGATSMARGTVVAVHHQSMEALTPPLLPSALPLELAGADIHPFDINQGSFYVGGILTTPGAAVRLQKDLATRLRAFLDSRPNAEIVYYGKAHAPLAFLAGHTLSTGAPIRLFELDRQTGDWRAIDQGEGEDLGLRVEWGASGDGASDVAVRISVSYCVHPADVIEALRQPYRDVHLSIAQPRVDAIRTKRQIETIARAFRQVLDQLHGEQPEPARIHVFYSGPMSLAFSLGRQISPTIHSSVLVYNFTAKTIPKYGWAVHINGDGSPESMVVPVSAAGERI